jgi:hypothetical protein
MKLNSAVSKFLTNKWVLNIVALLSLFNVIGYAVMGKINAVLYFIAFAVLVRYFSKNMTIVLGVPLIIVNLLAMRGNMLEGMENNKSSDSEKKSDDQKQIDKIVKKNNNKPDPKTGQGLPMQPLEHVAEAEAASSGEKQGFEPGRRKNKAYNIDYATTVEDAYDELNNILGSDGIQRLTSDTQSLMKQQMQLAEAMKGMAPMMQSLAPMVENLKGMMGDNNVKGMMELAEKFTGSSANK